MFFNLDTALHARTDGHGHHHRNDTGRARGCRSVNGLGSVVGVRTIVDVGSARVVAIAITIVAVVVVGGSLRGRGRALRRGVVSGGRAAEELITLVRGDEVGSGVSVSVERDGVVVGVRIDHGHCGGIHEIGAVVHVHLLQVVEGRGRGGLVLNLVQ